MRPSHGRWRPAKPRTCAALRTCASPQSDGKQRKGWGANERGSRAVKNLSESGENSLKQHGKGYSIGIPPLRASDFLKRKHSRGAPVGMTDAKGIGRTPSVWSALPSLSFVGQLTRLVH